MENLYFKTADELKQFLSDKECLGSGAEATCYKVGDTSVKIYKDFLNSVPNGDYNEEYFLKFADVNVDNFHFVKKLVYVGEGDDKKIIGTISEYAKGVALDYDVLFSIPIIELKELLRDLYRNIAKVSKLSINFGGAIYIKNIVYDGSKLRIIDTATFFYDEEELEKIFISNAKAVMDELLLGITGMGVKVPIIYDCLQKAGMLDYIFDNIELSIQPLVMINRIKQILEEDCGYEINCFKDYVPSNAKKKIRVNDELNKRDF